MYIWILPYFLLGRLAPGTDLEVYILSQQHHLRSRQLNNAGVFTKRTHASAVKSPLIALRAKPPTFFFMWAA